MKFQKILATAFAATAGLSHAAFGDRDCSFGNNGAQVMSAAFGAAYAATAEPSGSVLVMAGFFSTGSQLFRLDANGQSVTRLSARVTEVHYDPGVRVQADGGMVFVSGKGAANNAFPAGAGRVLPDGSVDASFGTNGFATVSGFVEAGAGPLLQPDDRIVVGGNVGGVAALVRFNANGTPDESFGVHGVAAVPAVGSQYFSIARNTDGSFLALGSTKLARHLGDGSLDLAFGANGIVDLSRIFVRGVQMRVQPSGNILVVGNPTLSSVPLRIARITSTGQLDRTVAGGTGWRDVTLPGVNASASFTPGVYLSLMPDGRPLVAIGVDPDPRVDPWTPGAGVIVRYGLDLADDTVVNLDFVPSFAQPLPSGRLMVGNWNRTGEVRRLLGDADASSCGANLVESISVAVDDPVVVEGSAGTALLAFKVSLSQPSWSRGITVDYGYQADCPVGVACPQMITTGSLAFGHGQSKRWLLAPVSTNTVAQANRTLVLSLTNATGAVIAKARGTGTIVDDDPSAASQPVVQYRLYSGITLEHLYTTDANEYAVLPSRGWSQEGMAYRMLDGTGAYGGVYTVPLHRFFHPTVKQHHWTADPGEAMSLARLGTWDYEGVAGYVLPSPVTGTIPLYRLSYPDPPLHVWTTDANEMTTLSTQRGWVYEGIVGYVLP